MPDKVSQSSVNYSPGTAKAHCGPTQQWPKGHCKHFIPPHACEGVAGRIDPAYWCERWSKAGSRMYRGRT
jgi:hypothetical protein